MALFHAPLQLGYGFLKTGQRKVVDQISDMLVGNTRISVWMTCSLQCRCSLPEGMLFVNLSLPVIMEEEN